MDKLLFTLKIGLIGIIYCWSGIMSKESSEDADKSGDKKPDDSLEKSLAKIENTGPMRFELIYMQTPAGYTIQRREVGVDGSLDELFRTLSRTAAQNFFLELIQKLRYSAMYKELLEHDVYGGAYSSVQFEVLPLSDLRSSDTDNRTDD